MKKFSLLLTMLLTASLTVLVGCQEPEEVKKEATLTIQTSVTTSAQGGTIELDYTLENPTEGVVLTASTPTAEWISNITIGESVVSFAVANNLAAGSVEREGSFVLGYNDKSLAEIIITQGVLEGTLAIEILDITPESLDVEITASNDQITWMCNFAPVKYVEDNGGIGEYVLLDADADAYRNSFYGDLLDDYLFTGSTTKTLTLKNPPLDAMYVWVVGIVRDNDTARTPVVAVAPVVKEFTFLPYPAITLAAEGAERFGIDAGSHSFTYTIENPIEGCEVSATAADGAESWVSNLSVDQHSQTISFDYDANTLAIERTGNIVVSYPYAESVSYTISQAENVQTEEITFEISIKEAHYNRVVVDCTPSNTSVKYALGALSKSEFEGYYYEGNPSKIPEIGLKASYPTHTFQTGVVSNVTLDNTAYNADEQWYVYAYAVDDAESIATSEVEMVAVTLINDAPTFEWVQGNGVSGTTLSVAAAGGTYTIAYTINNPVDGGVVTVDEPYDDILVKSDGKKVVLDQQTQTITFTVSANTTKKSRSTYVYLKYFSSETDTSSDANISLKISQSK